MKSLRIISSLTKNEEEFWKQKTILTPTFAEFVNKPNLKNQATSKVKKRADKPNGTKLQNLQQIQKNIPQNMVLLIFIQQKELIGFVL